MASIYSQYLFNTCKVFQDFIFHELSLDLPVKFLKYKSLENFHFYGTPSVIERGRGAPVELNSLQSVRVGLFTSGGSMTFK